MTWHVGPSATPADLGDRLLAHGLVHEEDEPGMALALSRKAAPPPAPAGLAIEEVRDARGLADWVAVWLFPVPAPGGAARWRSCAGGGWAPGAPGATTSAGWPAPVATAELFTAPGRRRCTTSSRCRRPGGGGSAPP